MTEHNEAEFDVDKIQAFPFFDVADHLDSEEMIAAYLAELADENDPALLAEAVADVARARARLGLANP